MKYHFICAAEDDLIATKQSFLLFDLPRNATDSGAPRGDLVATNIASVLGELKGLTTKEQYEKIIEQQETAKTKQTRAKIYKKLSIHSPIYSALAINIDPTSKPNIPHFLHLAILLAYCGTTATNKSDIVELSKQCIGIANLESEALTGTSSLIPKRLKPDALGESAAKLKDLVKTKSKPNTSKTSEINQLRKALIKATEIILDVLLSLESQKNSLGAPSDRVKRRKKHTNQIKRQRKERAKDLDDDFDNSPESRYTRDEYQSNNRDPDEAHSGVDGAMLSSQSNENVGDENATKAQGRKGHNLRTTNLYAGRSSEAFTVVESRKSLAALVNYQPLNSSHLTTAALILWLLNATFGRNYKELALACSGEDADYPSGIFKLSRSGDTYTITYHHTLAEDKFAELPAGIINESPAAVIQLSVALPPIKGSDKAWDYLRKCRNDSDELNALLEERDRIKTHIRNHETGRFTQTRLRGSVVQAHFQRKMDLPLTQLTFCEGLDSSLAALHYLHWSEKELQSEFNATLQDLYGDLLPAQPMGTDRLIGAPISALPLEIFRPATTWVTDSFQWLLRNKNPLDLVTYHNLLTKVVSHTLAVGSAHRGTAEFCELTINDICLAFGIIMYRDKPSDSSIFRRIAVMPTITRELVAFYLAWLKKLITQSNDKSAYEAADAALKGTRPLLFLIEDSQTSPISISSIFNELLPDIPVRIPRHLQSCKLRDFGAPALLVEAHLGHNFQSFIFGSNGLISPQELADTLRPYLDTWMTAAGYTLKVPPRKGVERDIKGSRDFHALHEQEMISDKERLRERIKSQLTSTTRKISRPERIDNAISGYVPNYARVHAPENVSIDRNTALEIRDNLIGDCDDDIIAVHVLCRALRGRLQRHKKRHNWKVELPAPVVWDIRPPLNITRAHMRAADQLIHYRTQLLDYAETADASSLFILARCALVLWADCKTWDESLKWMEAAESSIIIKDEPYILIDLSPPHAEARTIAGIPFVFVAAYLNRPSNSVKTNVSLQKILGKGANVDSLNATVKFARSIVHSGIATDLINGSLPSKELPVERLRQYNTNDIGFTGKPLPIESSLELHESLPRNESTPSQDAELFKKLWQLTTNPPKSAVGDNPERLRSASVAIKHWSANRKLSGLMTMITAWSLELLKAGANHKTGNELTYATVGKYIKIVWRVLSSAFAGYDINSLESDEATEQIESALSDTKSIQEAEINRFNRFWSEMSQLYELPPISLPTVGNAQSNIEAYVITDREIALSRQAIADWQVNTEFNSSYSPAIRDTCAIHPIYANGGVRRNEAANLRTKDVINDPLATYIIIRPHKDHTIKSKASHRTIPLPSPIQINLEKGRHLFSGLNTSDGAKALGLNIITASGQIATGSTSFRIHHFRHSKATKEMQTGLAADDPIQKIRLITRASADLGHASPRTTLSHYSHATFFTLSCRQINSVESLSNRLLANLFNEEIDLQRQHRTRAKQRQLPLAARYTRLLRGEKYKIKQWPIKSIPLPNQFKYQSKVLSLKTILLWLTRYARGESPLKAATGLNLNIETVISLLETNNRWAEMVKWRCIQDHIAQQDLEDLSKNQRLTTRGRKGHKRFPSPWVDRAIQDLHCNIAPATKIQVIQIAAMISWRRRGKIYISKVDDSLQNWAEALRPLSIGVAQQSDQADKLEILLLDGPQTKHTVNEIKLMLFGYGMFSIINN